MPPPRSLAAIAVLLTLWAVPTVQAQTIIYVDANNTPTGCTGVSTVAGLNGTSWDCAYPALQDAFDQANANAGTDYEIQVAEGTYVPDDDNVDQIAGDDDGAGGTEHAEDAEGESFTLSRDGVTVKGGYPTGGGTRAPGTNVTVLSGDIDADGGGDDDPFAPNSDSDGDFDTATQTDHLRGTNAHHVILLKGATTPITSRTVLDGLTVTAGQADGGGMGADGGGIYCNGSGGECSPRIRNVVMKGNFADINGGGLFFEGTGIPTIRKATFLGNAAQGGAGVFAVPGEDTAVATPLIVNTSFVNNAASLAGGGVYNSTAAGTAGEARTTVVNTHFENNEGNGSTSGGAITNDNNGNGTAEVTVVNATFADNSAVSGGGGIGNNGDDGTASVNVINSTFTGNTAGFSGDGGGAIRNGIPSPFGSGTATVSVQNSILWGNEQEVYNGESTSDVTFAHSILQGSGGSANWSGPGTDNGGNLDQDPFFVNPTNPKGADGIFATADDGLNVSPASPAADGGSGLPDDLGDLDGDNDTSDPLPQDLTGNNRERDIDEDATATVNIGAYEEPAPPSLAGLTDPVPYAGHPVLLTGRALAPGDVTYDGGSVPNALVSGDSLLARSSSTAEGGKDFNVTTIGGSDTSPAATFDRRAPYGPESALTFNGDDNHHVDGRAVDLSGSALTMEAWVKPSQFTSDNADDINTIAGIEGNGTALLRLGDAGLARDKPQFVLEFGGTQVRVNGSTALTTGTWHHVAGIYDGSEMKLYVDGRLDATKSQTGSFTANDVFRIGQSLGGRHFYGAMDQVRVWSTPLTTDELRRRMHRTVATEDGTAGDRALAYRFDAGGGDVAFDHTVALRHGLLDEGSFDPPPTRSVSGAPVGQTSAIATDGASGSVGPGGGTLSVSSVSVDGTVQAYQYGTLGGTRADTDPGEVLSGETRASLTWGLETVGSPTADLTIDYGGVTASLVQNPSDSVVVIRRDGPGQPWVNAPDWTHDPSTKTFTKTGAVEGGEYALKDGPFSPTVDDITPTSAYAGHPVELTGTSFAGVTDVRYNGTSVDYTIVSVDTIRARVPTTADSDGAFEVVTSGGSDTSPTVTLKDGPYAAEQAFVFDSGGPVLLSESVEGKDSHGSPSGPPLVDVGATTDDLGLTGGSFTVDLWVKPDVVDNNALFGTGFVPGETFEVGLKSDGAVRAELEGDVLTTAGSAVSTGEWTHVAVVYEADTEQGTIYVNGEQRATGSLSALTGTNDLAVGPGTFDGTLDQVRVWSGALTAEELRTRMYRTLAPDETGAGERELAYRFDEASTSVVYDHSGHFRHGTPQNVSSVSGPFSGARIGQESAIAVSGAPGSVGPDGGTVTASGVATDDVVQVYQFGALDRTRSDSDPGEDIPDEDTRSHLTWGLASVGTASATVTLDYSGVDLAQNPDDSVLLIRRDGPGDPWENAAGWTQDAGAQTFTKSGPVKGGQYALRDGPRTITNVQFENSGGNLDLSFTSDKQLGTVASALTVTVDGPSGPDIYPYDRTDFAETNNGDGTYTYDLNATQPFDDGDGTYTAVVDAAVSSGRNWATGESNATVIGPPTVTNVSLGGDGDDALALSFTTNKPLDTGSGAIQVTVDGPESGTDWRTFTDGDFALTSSQNLSYTYTLTTTQAYSDGEGAYTAVVDKAVDTNSNDGATGKSASYTFQSEPTVSNVVLDNDGSGAVVLRFESDTQLDKGNSAITVTVDGPTSGDDWQTFTDPDFSETDNGDGTFTYALTAAQEYADGPGTYTAVVDRAVDPDGNNGATGESDDYRLDLAVPTVSNVSLDNDGSGKLVLRFETDVQLDKGNDAIQVRVDGPETGADWRTFTDADFAESGTGPYTYTLATVEGYSDGSGTYTAVVETALNAEEEDGATGESDPHTFRPVTKATQQEAQRDSALTIDLTVGNGFLPTEDRALFVRKGGAADYQRIELEQQSATDDTLGLVGTIPGSLVTTRGVEYFGLFSNGADTLTVPRGGVEAARTRPRHLSVAFKDLAAPPFFEAEQYRMVSVPAVAEGGITDAISAASSYGTHNRKKWRLARWAAGDVEGRGAYRTFPEIDSLSVGEGFWLVTEVEEPFSIPSGRSVEADRPYRIPVAAGWNQIGTPFGFAVSWEAVRAASGITPDSLDGPFAYRDGAYEQADALVPWRGYFVFSASADTLVVPPVARGEAGEAVESRTRAGALWPSSDPTTGTRSQTQRKGETERYTLTVEAASKDTRTRVRLGLWPEAKTGRDAFDRAKPPSVTDELQLAAMEEVGTQMVAHSGSAKPPETDGGGDGQSWRLRLSAPADKGTSVTLRLQEDGAEGQSVYLLDLQEEQRLASGAELKLDAGETRTLKAIVGTEGYAAAKREGIDLSALETTLRDGYPNPFQEGVTLEYVLSEKQSVTIGVYDMLGRKVRTLVDERKEAGVHQVRWDGQSRQGGPVGSGMYFVRMRAADHKETKKVVRVR